MFPYRGRYNLILISEYFLVYLFEFNFEVLVSWFSLNMHFVFFNCFVSKYDFNIWLFHQKAMADQLSSWLPKHSDELGILKMHHKMHPERLRHSSNRGAIPQNCTSVTGLAISFQDLVGGSSLSHSPLSPEGFLVILAMVDRTQLSPEMYCDFCALSVSNLLT